MTDAVWPALMLLSLAAPEPRAIAPPPAALSALASAPAAASRGPTSLLLASDAAGPLGRFETRWPLLHAGDRGSRLELEAMAVTTARTGRTPRDARDLAWTARLAQRAARSGRWLGVSAGGAKDADGSSTLARLGLGAWRWLARFEVEVGVTAEAQRYENDSRFTRARIVRVPIIDPHTLPGDSIPRFRDSLVTEFDRRTIPRTTSLAALRWRRGRVEAEATGGVAVGPNLLPRRWAQSTLRVQVDRRVQVMASFGERAAGSLAFDPSAQPRTMVGVQVAPWAGGWRHADAPRPAVLAWRSDARSDGACAIRLRCRDAQRVELAADFTDWNAVALAPARGGWWAIALPIGPGVHRVRVRVDGGAWTPPAGLPRDDGGGEPAGLFVVE